MQKAKYIKKQSVLAPWRAEIFGIILATGTLFLIVALISYNPLDSSWFYASTQQQAIHNLCGIVGAQCAGLLFYLLGTAAWFLVGFASFMVYVFAVKRTLRSESDRIIAFILLILVNAALCTYYDIALCHESSAGGFCGFVLSRLLTNWFDAVGSLLLLYTTLITCFIIIVRFSWMQMAKLIVKGGTLLFNNLYRLAPLLIFGKDMLRSITSFLQSLLRAAHSLIIGAPQGTINRAALVYELFNESDGTEKTSDEVSAVNSRSALRQASDLRLKASVDRQGDPSSPFEDSLPSGRTETGANGLNMMKTQNERKEKIEKAEPAIIARSMQEKNNVETIELAQISRESGDASARTQERSQAPLYQLPQLSIFIGVEDELDDPRLKKDLENRARILEEKLRCFGVSGSVSAIKRGPVVTLYEYMPDIDTKISKIIALQDDLALALKAMSIRIIAPIPGRSVVGFEVANTVRKDVLLADTIQAEAFTEFSGTLPLILGKDTIGESVVVDLARMPHLLIAGSTGSGKSVALNGMLISLLCARTPKQMRLILIDPKRLEFTAYHDIAHLLFPVVTDPKSASPILRWVVQEMEERYKVMATVGARNLADYNAMAGHDSKPTIVVVIDELSDLMMTAGREIEGLIVRITQMARAAGIHMLVATQRPSVDVITGLIKVNFPSRISFRVTSKVDSRTILDCTGAETLLGRGDMLFLDSSDAQLKRVHGAFVSDQEIERVTSHIRAQQPVQYLDISKELATATSSMNEAEDAMYKEVLTFLEQVDEISISLLQRKFRIGYNRSARIIEMLEAHGIIMPSDNGKTRKVIK